jgi:hypothetical protein
MLVCQFFKMLSTVIVINFTTDYLHSHKTCGERRKTLEKLISPYYFIFSLRTTLKHLPGSFLLSNFLFCLSLPLDLLADVLEGRLHELADAVHLAGRDHEVVRRFHLNKNIYNKKLASFNEEDNNLVTFKTLCLFQCIEINYHFKNIAI